MATGAEVIKKYAKASEQTRINIICKNYSRFSRIIEGRIDGLVFLITEERAYLRRQEIGDLGVRIQVSGTGDVVGNTVANDEMIRIAIETCSFPDEMLDGSDYEDEIVEDAYAMKKMRKDYKLFNSMLGVLEPQEREIFLAFLNKKKSLTDIAEENGIQYDSADRRISRIKHKVIKEMSEYQRKMGNKS